MKTILALLLTLVHAYAADPSWAGPMRKVHAQFKGSPGTFAQFGDSITVTMAFWAPLQWKPRNMDAVALAAHERVSRTMKPDCWRTWKGAEFGSEGGMTVRWAFDNVDKWLMKLNPEVAIVMFGSNDVRQMDVKEYETKLRAVVERCLKNGTVVILSTMPPRSGHVEKVREFAEAARRLATELHVPLSDYHAEIVKRRPDDWDGSAEKFKAPGDVYDVPTLIARDGVHPSVPKQFGGDFSAEALNSHGYNLRNYLTLLAYAEVIEKLGLK
jgi:hypothetical protein